jgi:hypothetical protein
MKTKSLYIVLIIGILLTSMNIAVEAQRRVIVVKRPSRTVVVTRVPRSRVVYVNHRVIRPPVVVRTPPAESVAVVYGRTRYFYHAGFYYAMRPEGYVVVPPPAGIVITVLPPRCVRVIIRSGTFFYIGGVFYTQVTEGYKVVDPPAGAQVEELPEDAEKVNVEGKIFYEHNGTLYKKVETENGFAYEVSGNVEG